MKKLELLKKIRPVEAPPFLFTRIQAKIRSTEAERLPASWRWAGRLAFVLLLVLNVFAFKTGKTPLSVPAEQLNQSMQLANLNQLYDE